MLRPKVAVVDRNRTLELVLVSNVLVPDVQLSRYSLERTGGDGARLMPSCLQKDTTTLLKFSPALSRRISFMRYPFAEK